MAQVTGGAAAGQRETGVSRAQTEAWLLDVVHPRRLSPTHRRVVQSMLDSMPDAAFVSTVDAAALERTLSDDPAVDDDLSTALLERWPATIRGVASRAWRHMSSWGAAGSSATERWRVSYRS